MNLNYIVFLSTPAPLSFLLCFTFVKVSGAKKTRGLKEREKNDSFLSPLIFCFVLSTARWI